MFASNADLHKDCLQYELRSHAGSRGEGQGGRGQIDDPVQQDEEGEDLPCRHAVSATPQRCPQRAHMRHDLQTCTISEML